MMVAVRLLAASLWLLPLPGRADDGVASTGVLSDHELWQLVACGATPGQPCQTALARWPAATLTIATLPAAPAMPPETARAVDMAVRQATLSINAAGAGIRLVQVSPDSAPDIRLIPTSLPAESIVKGIDGIEDGDVIGAGYMTYWYTDADMITRATILIAGDIAPGDVGSVVLEEITQALGLRFDINNPAYHDVSIFSQTSNSVVTISGQDAAVLRLHYPPAQ